MQPVIQADAEDGICRRINAPDAVQRQFGRGVADNQKLLASARATHDLELAPDHAVVRAKLQRSTRGRCRSKSGAVVENFFGFHLGHIIDEAGYSIRDAQDKTGLQCSRQIIRVPSAVKFKLHRRAKIYSARDETALPKSRPGRDRQTAAQQIIGCLSLQSGFQNNHRCSCRLDRRIGIHHNINARFEQMRHNAVSLVFIGVIIIVERHRKVALTIEIAASEQAAGGLLTDTVGNNRHILRNSPIRRRKRQRDCRSIRFDTCATGCAFNAEGIFALIATIG